MAITQMMGGTITKALAMMVASMLSELGTKRRRKTMIDQARFPAFVRSSTDWPLFFSYSFLPI